MDLNFIDVYQRDGLYPLPMPLHLAMEAWGLVAELCAGVLFRPIARVFVGRQGRGNALSDRLR